MDFLPWSTFTRIVARYGGDQRLRTLSCAEHYRAMAFAQLTCRESLRDIETCLSVQVSKLYSMGFRDRVGSGRAQKAVVNILWIEVCNGVHRVDRITPNLLSLGHRQRPEYCERRRVCKMRP